MNSPTGFNDHQPADTDIVQTILQRVIAMAPQFSQALATQIEQEMRAQYGGQRVFVSKTGKKFLTDAQRLKAYQDGLSHRSTEDVANQHGISRATLYRLMKQGPEKPRR